MKAFVLSLLSLALVAGTAMAAQGQATSASPAGTSGCGRVSIFDVAPRSQEIYGARVMNIDGRLPGATGTKTFKLPAGRHVLEVAELIDPEQFNDVQRRQRDMRSDPYKELVVDVAPDTTYLLGARLVTAHRGDIIDGSYWEPVIYHQTSEPCQ